MKLANILEYVRLVRNTLKDKESLPASEHPFFWVGSGGCGFLRVYDLLQKSGGNSVFFKSAGKLQNYKIVSESDLVWERADDETIRVQKYFAKNGIYDHHIAPYTIRYVKEIIRCFPNAIFVCLKSKRSIEPMWLQWGYRNPLVTDRSRKNRYPVELYPDLTGITRDRKIATQAYYDLYYGLAEECRAAYPDNFHIIDADQFFSNKTYFDSINKRFYLGLEFKQTVPNCNKELITTSLHGGLGNNLFQMAEPVAFCAEHNLPKPVFATWNMSDFPPDYRSDAFIGGHSGTPEGLQRTFPNIQWLPSTSAMFDDKFIVNDMYSFVDIHHQRDAILAYFQISSEVKQKLLKTYPYLLEEKTISLHYRVGGLKADTHTFNALSIAWYKDILTEYFPRQYHCFVFSDNKEAAGRLISELEKSTKNTYHLIEEGVFNSVAMMSMCKNHILSNSTLSFWGAYLDPAQPYGGKTILHESFVTYHSEPHIECRMLPYLQWQLL